MSAVMAPSAMVGSVTDGSLKALTLTGNREMAEDLERVACSTCSRLFAPSVLSRHAPICAARAAKNAPPPPPSAAPPTPAWSNSSEIAAPSCLQLTPTAGRVLLQELRPSVSAAIDLARARGMICYHSGRLPHDARPSQFARALRRVLGGEAIHFAESELSAPAVRARAAQWPAVGSSHVARVGLYATAGVTAFDRCAACA